LSLLVVENDTLNNGPGLQDSKSNFVLAEFSADASPVPEPTTLQLWGTMATGLGFLLRRRGWLGAHTG
jgi:hypothetical protein